MGVFRERRGGETPRPDSDADLIAEVAGGHVDALRLLHHRHAPWLKARLSHRCADPDMVEVAIQDTFVAVWQGAARYQAQGEDAGAWIWTIAVRKLISVLRKRGSSWIGASDDLGDGVTTQSAEDLVLLGVQHGDLGTELRRLSPELRAVIQTTVLDGLTVKEAAQLLGIPEGTVKTRVKRAKAQLRERLA